MNKEARKEVEAPCTSLGRKGDHGRQSAIAQGHVWKVSSHRPGMEDLHPYQLTLTLRLSNLQENS